MSAKIIERNEKSIKIKIEIPLSKSMLITEENISKSLNEAGNTATEEFLSMLDTDGSPVKVGTKKYTYPNRKKTC